MKWCAALLRIREKKEQAWLVKKKEMVNEYFITSTNIRVKATQIITLLKHFVLVQHCLDTEPATSNREIHKIRILHGGIPWLTHEEDDNMKTIP
jgi:hypothetical protein